jgi:hypothetical protein
VARIAGTIGLKNVGALEPAEIAVSILAELSWRGGAVWIPPGKGSDEPGGEPPVFKTVRLPNCGQELRWRTERRRDVALCAPATTRAHFWRVDGAAAGRTKNWPGRRSA